MDGGAERDRTADLVNAIHALSQLSYGPIWRDFAQSYVRFWEAEPTLRLEPDQAALAAGVVIILGGKFADRILGKFYLVFQKRHRIVIGGVRAEVGFFLGKPLW